MQGLAHPFEDRIHTETCIIKGNLQPVEPEEREEADVGFNRCPIVKTCGFTCEEGMNGVQEASSML